MPSLDTAPAPADENGLTALITCGSLATLAVAWFTADWSALTVPCRAWNTICPEYPPCCGKSLFSRSSPFADSVPGDRVVVHVGAAPVLGLAPSAPPRISTQAMMTIQCRRAANEATRSSSWFMPAFPPSRARQPAGATAMIKVRDGGVPVITPSG